METGSLEELWVLICLIEPMFLSSMDELVCLHGGELVTETRWYKESPKTMQSSLQVP